MEILFSFEVDDIFDKTVDAESSISNTWFGHLWNTKRLTSPTRLSSAIVTWTVTLYCVFCLILSLVVTQLEDEISNASWYAILLLVIAIVLIVGSLVIIKRQPMSSKELSFTVPFVPWLPGVSILVNIYLMMMLDYMTWVRFLIWIIVGLAIYFGYGVWHSKERPKVKNALKIQRSTADVDESVEEPTVIGMSKDNLVKT